MIARLSAKARVALLSLLWISLISSAACGSTLDEVYQLVNQLENSRCARPVVLTRSMQGRQVLGVVVTDFDVPIRDKTRIVIVSGQHGNEPHAALSTARLAVKWSSSPDFARIRRNAIVLIVPAANPDGLANGRRCDPAGTDPNRDWKRLSLPETRAIAHVIGQWKPHLVIDEHEWSSTDGHRFNCVESSPSPDSRRLSWLTRRIRRDAVSSEFSGVDCRPGRDESLLHRHFRSQGYLAYLVETAPNESAAAKERLYEHVTVSLAKQAIAGRQMIERCSVAGGQYEVSAEMLAGSAPQPTGPTQPTAVEVAIGLAAIYCLALVFGRTKRLSGERTPNVGQWAYAQATPHGSLPGLTCRSLASKQSRRGRRISGRAVV